MCCTCGCLRLLLEWTEKPHDNIQDSGPKGNQQNRRNAQQDQGTTRSLGPSSLAGAEGSGRSALDPAMLKETWHLPSSLVSSFKLAPSRSCSVQMCHW